MKENARGRPWSPDSVRAALGIEGDTYDRILICIREYMIRTHLLGARINSSTSKDRIKPVFLSIKAQFMDVFGKVSNATHDSCLIFMAQRYSYNQRRRRKCEDKMAPSSSKGTIVTRRPSPSFLHTDTDPAFPITQNGIPHRAFDKIIVQTCKGNRYVACLLEDIIGRRRQSTLDDVDDQTYRRYQKYIT